MTCRTCPLNIDSKCFNSEMIKKIPLHFRNIFLCNEDCATSSNASYLCGKDLWVLTFIGQKEKFAMNNAVSTMETLVYKGLSELLCNLFENAPYEKRREMWQKMTREHSDRLYMFDALFERHSLAPINSKEAQNSFIPYQNTALFPNLAYTTA